MTEQLIITASGLTLCVAFIALLYMANRARSRQTGNARRVEPVRDDAENRYQPIYLENES